MNLASDCQASSLSEQCRRIVRLAIDEDLGDVGDLMKLVQAAAGVRAIPDARARLAHELADCLWSVMVLADLHGIDLEQAFLETMDALEELRLQLLFELFHGLAHDVRLAEGVDAHVVAGRVHPLDVLLALPYAEPDAPPTSAPGVDAGGARRCDVVPVPEPATRRLDLRG